MDKELIKQSDSVTFSKYRMSSWQINCLVNVVENLQEYINMDIDWSIADGKEYLKYFKLNEDLNFSITVPISQIENHNNYGAVKAEILKLMNLKVEYDFIDNKGKPLHKILIPFNHVDIPEKGGSVILRLSISSLRWILQWSQRTKLTTFDKKSILSLRGVYSKRIFQILSNFYKERIFKMKIDKLSEILMTPKYSVQDFERFVLKIAQMEMINNPDSRLFFKYKLVSEEKKRHAGRPRRDTVIFKIYDSKSSKSLEEFKIDKF